MNVLLFSCTDDTCPGINGTAVVPPIALPFKSTNPTIASTGPPAGGVTGPATVSDARRMDPSHAGRGGYDKASVMVNVAGGPGIGANWSEVVPSTSVSLGLNTPVVKGGVTKE